MKFVWIKLQSQHSKLLSKQVDQFIAIAAALATQLSVTILRSYFRIIMASCKELQSFANEILSFVQEILDQIQKLLSVLLSKSNNIFGPQISSIISRNGHLRQHVRETLLLLQDDVLKTCESLANYGTNKEMYGEVRGEISRKETRQLKKFLDVCTRRLNDVKDSYDEFCSVTIRLLEEIDKAMQECVQLLEEKKASYSWRGFGVGAAGLAVAGGAAALVLSPIAVPAMAVAAVGTGGGFGFLTGVYMYFNPNDDDIKIVAAAHAELKQLNSIIDKIHMCANKSAYMIRGSARDLKSHKVIGLSEQTPGPEGRLKTVNIPKCFGLDNSQLKELTEHPTDLNVTLDEFEGHMKSLLAGTTDARAKTEACIKKFPGV